jgi:site-specific recombinase XerD
MAAKSTAIVTQDDFQPVIDLVINGLDSEHSRRAYGKAIADFLAWWVGKGKPPMVKATVQDYRKHLQDLPQGLSPATINQRMAAIRKLALEAADNGLIPQDTANGIGKVKGVKVAGVRVGNWLTQKQAQALINSPDVSTIKGLRDRGILALFLGAGLRRSEVADLTFEHIQQREGRWVIVDLVGKGGRVRTVPIPSWTKQAIDEWSQVAGVSSGRVFRGVYHYGKSLMVDSRGITPQAVFYAVQEAVHQAYKATNDRVFLEISPHDLRRSFAKLARKGGAELTQIQLTLGHSSVAVTQGYIGEDQDLTDAPCDRLGLDLGGD